MKKLGIKLGVCALALMMAMSFTACEGPRGPQGPGFGLGGRSVDSGTFLTSAVGYSRLASVYVETTFAANAIIDVRVISHAETERNFDAVMNNFITRIIQAQSIGVDVVTGSTITSFAIRDAVEAAIELANGDVDDWWVSPPRDTRTVVLASAQDPFDVVVVGLGAAGTAAFLAAAGERVAVFGLEAAGHLGRTAAAADGAFGLASRFTYHTLPGTFEQMVQNFVQVMGLVHGGLPGLDPSTQVMFPEASAVTQETVHVSASPDGGTRTVQGWAGGARMDVFETFIRYSGETINFMDDWGWPLLARITGAPVGATGYRNSIGRNPPTAGNTFMVGGTHNVVAALRPLWYGQALRRATGAGFNPRNDFMVELRGTRIITNAEGVITGVEAQHRDGRNFVIHGRTVVLATGGFLGDTSLMNQNFGTWLHVEAANTNVGDGIRMGVDLGAATFNLRAPPVMHRGYLNTAMHSHIDHPHIRSHAQNRAWIEILQSLMHRPQNLVVALAPGFDGVNRVGERFLGEAVTPVTGAVTLVDAGQESSPSPTTTAFGAGVESMVSGLERWIIVEGQRAGGRFAAVFSNDYLYRLLVNPLTRGDFFMDTPGLAGMNINYELIRWALGSGNAFERDSISALATAMGIPPAVLQATIDGYNDIVTIARGIYADWDASGTPPEGFQDWTVAHDWDYNHTVWAPGGSPDPLSYVFNPLHGTYNLGKPLQLAGAIGRLWDQPVTLDLAQQQANWDAFVTEVRARTGAAAPTVTQRAVLETFEFRPGFTAIVGRHGSFGTIGGLDVDTEMRVLRLGDNHIGQEYIPGLFAAGHDSYGVIHHRNRTYSNAGAQSHGWSLTSGRLAGMQAAADAAAMGNN